MDYYKLSPAVPGGLGPGTQWDESVSPPKITVLEMEIDGWDGDELLECSPAFMVTEALEARLLLADLSGWSSRPMVARTTETFDELYPGERLPRLVWLDVVGSVGVDDFAVTKGQELVVSEKVLEVIGGGLPTGEYTIFIPGVTPE